MADRVSIVTVEVESQVLRDNPLGDPTRRELIMLLPPGYEQSGLRYPVLFGLVGFTGAGAQMLNWDPWQPNLRSRLESLYVAGMPHVIVVLPNCFTALGGSQYINSEATGNYESYILDELVPYVDANFRTLGGPEGRGVFGKSSGGYGAFMLAMRHPDVFGALACHSGDMNFEWCYKPDFPKTARALDRAGGLEEWYTAFKTSTKPTGDDSLALNIVAMAACYSPDSSKPMGIAFPFDFHTLEQDDAVWARWLDMDPLHIVPRYADNLKRLRLLYFDCGDRDEFNLQFGARLMSRSLDSLGVKHTHQEFEDGHMSVQYRYSVSLPLLAAALDKASPA